MKKKILLLLCFCIFFTGFIRCVNGDEIESENINDISQLSNYIISGTGTQDDPYVIDDSCPYKAIMDQQIASIFAISDHNSDYISLQSDFNGALTVCCSIALNGGYWKCTSNYPTTDSNGTCWIQKIDYVSNADVRSIAMGLSNTSFIQAVYDAIENGKSGLALKQWILNYCAYQYGWNSSTVITGNLTLETLASGFMHLFYLYAGVQIMTAAINSLQYSTLMSWYGSNYGQLNVYYAISYNGSWYQTYTETAWTTYALAYAPAAFYGGTGASGFVAF